MQVLTAKEIECSEEGKVSYEIQWIIPNWREVRQDVSLLKKQKAVFETGLQSPQMFETKWIVGLKDAPAPPINSSTPTSKVYWQLLDIKGSPELQLKLDAKMSTSLCRPREPSYKTELQVQVNLGEIIEERNGYLDIGLNCGAIDDRFINTNGAIEYKLVLAFKLPDTSSSASPTQFKKLKLEQFSKRSRDQLHKNLASLLHEDSFCDGDLKIITSDGVELLGHQTVLKVQCPVFAAMLNSDLSERKTGILKVDDISGKTMRILLHYFYTGDLVDGWNDGDTIVEFTYAAGKYQITQILELLDDMLGRDTKDEVSNLGVQLLNLAGKLSLGNAEKRLLQLIVGKISGIKKSEELFQLFGWDEEEICRRAEITAGDSIGGSKVMEIVDYAFRSNPNLPEDFSNRGLNLLAFVQRNGMLKTLEEVLLKRFARITSKIKSGKEFFELFAIVE